MAWNLFKAIGDAFGINTQSQETRDRHARGAANQANADAERRKAEEQAERERQKRAWQAAHNNITGADQSQESSSGNGFIDYGNAGASALGGEGGLGGSTGPTGPTSPLLEGEMTFEELIGEICNGIDLCFIVKRSTVVVTDYESLYAEAKYLRDNHHTAVSDEDIGLWQLADGTYELDVAEYGFYNTVIVNYKNGTVTESYEDLVRVYGEVPITYDDKEVDKTTAIMKAKAYLAAHVRDFEMTVKASLLHDGNIDIGDIVTIENPMTMRDSYRQTTEQRDPEYFFVTGNSISWEGDGPIINDIELRYGAKAPNKKEVPEVGASYSGGSATSSGAIQSALDEVGKQWSGIGYCGSCQTSECVKQTGCGDCHGASDLIACELASKGVTTKIVQYAASASNHRSVLYKDSDGTWRDFPYREYGFNTLFNNTSGSANGTEIPKTCGG